MTCACGGFVDERQIIIVKHNSSPHHAFKCVRCQTLYWGDGTPVNGHLERDFDDVQKKKEQEFPHSEYYL